MFRIWGHLQGEPVSATWRDDGRLEGDARLLDAAAQLVSAGASVSVTPTGPTTPADLDTGWSALMTLTEVLHQEGAWGGFEGEAPEAPPGIGDYGGEPGEVYGPR